MFSMEEMVQIVCAKANDLGCKAKITSISMHRALVNVDNVDVALAVIDEVRDVFPYYTVIFYDCVDNVITLYA